jgi:putative addiction module component (TIGR02574 family)
MEEQEDPVFDLWDELIEPSEELKTELDRRLSAYKANPTNLFTWDQMLERRHPLCHVFQPEVTSSVHSE